MPAGEVFHDWEAFKQLGSWRIDRSAYIGFPKSLADAASEYIEHALSSLPPHAALIRPLYKQTLGYREVSHYQFHETWRFMGSEPVPILVLPPPGQIRGIFPGLARSDKYQTAKVLGRTILFDAGWFSANPFCSVPVPIGSYGVARDLEHNPPHLRMGKIVLNSSSSDDLEGELLSPLRVGKLGGATLLAWLRTIPVAPGNPILRTAQLESPNQSTTEWVAYAIADANGSKRGNPVAQENGESSFSKPLLLPMYWHDPRVDRFSLLRLPMPLDLTRTGRDIQSPYEELVLDEWFAQVDPPVFVLTLDPRSSPFRETFILCPVQPGVIIDGQIWLVIVFSNAEPRKLLTALKTLTDSADWCPENEGEMDAAIKAFKASASWHPTNEATLLQDLQRLRERALSGGLGEK